MIGSLLTAVALLAASPAQDVAAAVSLLHFVEPAAQQQTRFLALSHIAPEHRHETALAITHLCNAVSRNRIIFKPTATDLTLAYLRLDLAALSDPKNQASFGEVLAAWEALTVNDPRYHVRTNVATTAGLQAVTVDAGHVGLANADRLRTMTGSQGAILAADWFIAQVAVPPAYYQFLGVPLKEADLFGLLGVNAELIATVAADGAANLTKSLITGRPRRLIRVPAPLGTLWRTKDPGQDQTPDADPFRAPVDATVGVLVQKFNYAAGEHIWTLPNGFLGFALYNAAGDRQNDANGIGVTDHLGPAGHQSLVPMLSCVRCHERQGADGFQPFVDEQHTLRIKETTAPEIGHRTIEVYHDQPRLQRQLTRDREDHAAAVLLATGTTPKAATEALVATFERYTYAAVGVDVAAAECGVDVETFIRATEQVTDHGVQMLRDGKTIARRTWEASFYVAIAAVEAWKEC